LVNAARAFFTRPLNLFSPCSDLSPAPHIASRKGWLGSRLAIGGERAGRPGPGAGVLASRRLDTVSGQAASLDPVSVRTLPGKPRFGGVFCVPFQGAAILLFFASLAAPVSRSTHIGTALRRRSKSGAGDTRSPFAFGAKPT